MRPTVLAYHDVVPRGARGSSGFAGAGPDRYKVDPAVFAEHLDAVRDTGCVLTFDDGGASALEHAAPALQARGLTGVFFVVSGLVGERGFLDADGVRALRGAGHTVGSHSHTHPVMTRLPDERVRDEWRRSKDTLEELLGAEVETLSVPRGYVTRRILELAAECGYRSLYTSEPWRRPRPVGDALAHGRFAVTEATPTAHVAALARGDRGAVWRDAAGWYARKAAKRAAGPAYDRARSLLLSRAARGGPGTG